MPAVAGPAWHSGAAMIDPDLLALIARSPGDSPVGTILRDMQDHVANCRLCSAGQAASCPDSLALAHALASAAHAADIAQAAGE